MATTKKKGSLLGKLVVLVILLVVFGVPGSMVYYGQLKKDTQGNPVLGEAKWFWDFSTEDWNAYKGWANEIKKQTTDTIKDKYAQLRDKAKAAWADVNKELKHKTKQTEKLYIEREALLAQLKEVEEALPENARETSGYDQSVAYGVEAFRNSLREWEASLKWNPEQAKGGLKFAQKQMGLAVNNFADALKTKDDPGIKKLHEWAQAYQVDFKARTDELVGADM